MLQTYDIFVVDGSSYLFRAYHALPALTNHKQEPTGAIYGVLNMLVRHLRQKPAHMVVVFDAPGPTFRHEQYTDYKANRSAMPDDLACQIPILHRLINHLGIPMLCIPGVEADDVIATLAKRAQRDDMRVLISTGDKDLAQLVTEEVHLLNTMSDEHLDPEGVLAKFGVLPEQIVDYLTLIGDKSDNIPGVDKVGPKTAVKWLSAYQNLDNLMAHADEIKGVVGENLRAACERLPWVRSLIHLQDEVPLAESWQDFLPGQWQKEALASMLSELNFRRLADELLQKKVELRAIVSGSEAKAYQGFLTCLQEQWVLLGPQIVFLADLALIKDQPLVCLNAYLTPKAIVGRGDFDDLTLMQYVVNASLPLDDVALWLEKTLGVAAKAVWLSAMQGQASQEDWSLLATWLEQLHAQLKEAMDVGRRRVYEWEKQLLPVIIAMQETGVGVDVSGLAGLHDEWQGILRDLEQQIWQMAGQEFNIQSPQQLAEVLFVQLALPVLEKTPAGKPSTSESVLSQMAKTEPLAALILDYRHYAKLLSTYTTALADLAVAGRIHGQFIPYGTNTGRLSSRSPNLQNIPIRTQEGRRIRRCFIPAEGHCLLALDYSQIELRLLAELADDPGLKAAFAEGEDIHQRIASEVFQVPLAEVDGDLRRRAKAINFGIIYGISAFGLARQLDLPVADAKGIIDAYFVRFPAIQAFMQRVITEAREQGHVRTPLGRSVPIAGIHAPQAFKRQAAERQAINAPVQGMAADIMKMAMVKTAPLAKQHQARLVLQVHDELVFEVPKAAVETLAPLLQADMEQVVALGVPLQVSYGIGDNWDEAH